MHYPCHRYVDFYKLSEPCDDIESALDSVSKRIGALTKGIYNRQMRVNYFNLSVVIGGVYDHHRSARHFLQMYRGGKLGIITLD